MLKIPVALMAVIVIVVLGIGIGLGRVMTIQHERKLCIESYLSGDPELEALAIKDAGQ